jgi:hypothetical protein
VARKSVGNPSSATALGGWVLAALVLARCPLGVGTHACGGLGLWPVAKSAHGD